MKTIDLSKGFCIKAEDSSNKWNFFITKINSTNNSGSYFRGTSWGSYYGMTPSGGGYSTSYEPPLYQVITLEQWFEINNVEMIQCYDGHEYMKDLCVLLGGDSEYEGQYAPLNKCLIPDYGGGGYILQSESISTYHGETFPRNRDSDYGIVHSDHHSEYFHEEDDDLLYGYAGYRRDEDYFLDRHGEAVLIEGCWYRNREVANDYGFVQSNGEWFDASLICKDNSGYQSLERRFKDVHRDAKFRIGFEIEKEDKTECEIGYEELYNRTGWCKEDDGSLCSHIGYELVSPCYDLFHNTMDKDIADSQDLKDLINASYSDNCGGHINLSSTLFNPEQLFEHISGYFPLFYAIYENRMSERYSRAKRKGNYIDDRGKYSSFYIKPNVLEIRIPPAVKSVTNLLWRRDLIRIICKSIKLINKKGLESYYAGPSEVEVLISMTNEKSALYKHLRKVYTTDELTKKVQKFVEYSKSYNDKHVPRVTKFLSDDLGDVTDSFGA
jgi:hypothetical protein